MLDYDRRKINGMMNANEAEPCPLKHLSLSSSLARSVLLYVHVFLIYLERDRVRENIDNRNPNLKLFYTRNNFYLIDLWAKQKN